MTYEESIHKMLEQSLRNQLVLLYTAKGNSPEHARIFIQGEIKQAEALLVEVNK